MNPTDNITIGLDLGDRRHTVCVLSAGGDIVTEATIVNTRACLEAFAARFPAATNLNSFSRPTSGLILWPLRSGASVSLTAQRANK